MATYVYYQLYVFLATFYGGVIIGLIYDVYRVFRRVMKPSRIGTIIQDLLFWLVVTFIALSVLFYSNDGSLRGFTFIGFLTGAIIYNKLLSEFVLQGLIAITDFISDLLKRIFRNIVRPFKFVGKNIKKPYNKLKLFAKPYYLRGRRILTLPRRVLYDIKKYSKTISSKK